MVGRTHTAALFLVAGGEREGNTEAMQACVHLLVHSGCVVPTCIHHQLNVPPPPPAAFRPT